MGTGKCTSPHDRRGSAEFSAPPNPEMFSGSSLHLPLLQPDYSTPSRASGSLALDSAQNRADISVIEFNDAGKFEFDSCSERCEMQLTIRRVLGAKSRNIFWV